MKDEMNRNRIIDGCNLPTEGTTKAFVKLTPDKTLLLGHFIPPIKWTGYVQNYEVEIVQINNHAYSQSNFEYIKFPEEFDDLKDDIVKGIDDAMRVMD